MHRCIFCLGSWTLPLKCHHKSPHIPLCCHQLQTANLWLDRQLPWTEWLLADNYNKYFLFVFLCHTCQYSGLTSGSAPGGAQETIWSAKDWTRVGKTSTLLTVLPFLPHLWGILNLWSQPSYTYGNKSEFRWNKYKNIPLICFKK